MPIRQEVQDLVDAGPLPDENASEEEIDEAGRLLDRIERPVTDEEAQALATLFGPDGCYGIAWSLLHLIETAPGAEWAVYAHNPDDEWTIRLNARVEATRCLDCGRPRD